MNWSDICCLWVWGYYTSEKVAELAKDFFRDDDLVEVLYAIAASAGLD